MDDQFVILQALSTARQQVRSLRQSWVGTDDPGGQRRVAAESRERCRNPISRMDLLSQAQRRARCSRRALCSGVFYDKADPLGVIARLGRAIK